MHSAVQVTLANREDYLQFYPMLLNEQCLKSTGRQLHPAPRFVFSNLEPNSEYTMSAQFRKTSGYQWQYCDNEWRPVGSKESPVNEKAPEIQHPDGARFGARWNQNDTSFTIRLTNKSSTAELVGLTSLCKYMIVLVIRQIIRQPDGQYAEHGDALEFLFPETEFIAVSRYYDPRVSDIKSATNKFSSRNAKKKRIATGTTLTILLITIITILTTASRHRVFPSTHLCLISILIIAIPGTININILHF
uniref:T-box domain-containing protein n=1 Tax=Caenorhabditis japonica TaxID=281687 RepID=A0A8R1EDJ5_CAEJA